MPGPFGLSRAVLHRARAEWPVVAAAFLLLLAATTLLAAGALYADTIAVGGLRRALLAVPVADRVVLVRLPAAVGEVAGIDGLVRPEVERALAEPGGEVALTIRSGTFADRTTDPAHVTELTILASLERLDEHADIVEGRWAEPGRLPVEATLSEGAAAALGLAVGDRISLVHRLEDDVAVELVVSGLWRADPEDPYFLDDPLESSGVEVGTAFTTFGPFVVARDDLLAHGGRRSMDAEWRGLPEIDGLRADRLTATAADIVSLRQRLSAALPTDVDPTITTRLPELLKTSERAVLVSRSGVLLLTAQFAVLAGYAVLLVAGMLAERRRAEVALLRSRGASTAQIATMSLLEAVALAIPTVIVAPILAVALVELLGRVGPLASVGLGRAAGLDGTVLPVTIVATLLGVVALTLPSIPSGESLTSVRAALGRPSGRTLAQRLGVDLALVVVAAIALWQLRLYGAPLTENARGAIGIDPLLVAAPAIGLIAGAVLAIRIVPRLAEIGERAFERRRGLVSPLGARQLARRPLRYTRAALLLMLAAALGTFAAAHAATWTGSQADQAAYQAAADLRVIESDHPTLSAWAAGPSYRAVQGVAAATPVVRQTLDVGRSIRSGKLLALDPSIVGAMVTLPPESRTAPAPDGRALLAPLVDGRWTAPSVAIRGAPRRLAISVTSDLAIPRDQLPPGEPVPTGGALTLAVVLIDGDGRLHRFAGGQVDLLPGGRMEVPLVEAVGQTEFLAAGPVSLVAVELTIAAPVFHSVVGSLEIDELAVSDALDGDEWTAVAFDPGAVGWSWLRVETVDPRAGGRYDPPTGAPGRIELRSIDFVPGGPLPTPTPSWPVNGSPTDPPTVFRLAASPTPPASGSAADGIPAIVSESFLAASGSAVGDVLEVATGGQDVRLRLVGSVRAFPSLQPTNPFAIVDSATLDLARFADAGQVVRADEWWLAVDDARVDAVTATLAKPMYAADETVGRVALIRSLTADPIPLGVIGALGLGAVAAMAFAAIGFVVSAAVSTDERMGEFALLQALGLSGRQLSAWLSIEHGFLLAVGLLSGAVIGLALAWLVLPFATLTVAGTVTVPAPVVVLPIEALLPLVVLALALLVGTVALVTRQLGKVDLAGVLRAQDG